MPEGDTVYKLAVAIRQRIVGAVIVNARVRLEPRGTFKRQSPRAAGPGQDDRGESLIGHRVESVHTIGKHLFFQFDHGALLRSHLGMYGSWHRYRPHEAWKKPEWQASLALWTDQDVMVCFNAKEVALLHSGSFQHTNLTRRLGPDLLSPSPDLDLIVQRAREFLDPGAPLVDVLLDQRAACGVGNVFKSEVLFIEKLHPLTHLGDTSDHSLRRLYATASELLRKNLGGGRRVTRFVHDGRARLWVYGRRDRLCLICASRVASAPLGTTLRITYWCPRCQDVAKGDLDKRPSIQKELP